MVNKIIFVFKSLKLKLASYVYDTRCYFKREKSFIKKILRIILLPYHLLLTLIGIRVYIPYVELVVTTYCTLNCKGCSALMNYYKKRCHYSKDTCIESVKRMCDSVTAINYFKILGGEPLCYPDLYELLKYINTQDKINTVAVTTNGTLTIMDDKVLEILKNKKFYVSISNYGKNSRKIDELVNQLKENNIRYVVMPDNYKWLDYGGFDKRKRSKDEFRKQFLYCSHKVRSLLNGKYYHCFRCSHACNLGLIKSRKKDYVDLLDYDLSTKDLKKKLYKFIYKYTDYTEACKYCDCLYNNTDNVIDKGIQNENKA